MTLQMQLIIPLAKLDGIYGIKEVHYEHCLGGFNIGLLNAE